MVFGALAFILAAIGWPAEPGDHTTPYSQLVRWNLRTALTIYAAVSASMVVLVVAALLIHVKRFRPPLTVTETLAIGDAAIVARMDDADNACLVLRVEPDKVFLSPCLFFVSDGVTVSSRVRMVIADDDSTITFEHSGQAIPIRFVHVPTLECGVLSGFEHCIATTELPVQIQDALAAG